jgi:hypothetical protein
MVNALEIYGNGNGTFLNVKIAREDKLLNKWLTITETRTQKFTEENYYTKQEEKITKIILNFTETDYELVLNKTNAQILIHDFGPETDTWINQHIKLKVQIWANQSEGLVIKSKQELKDENDTTKPNQIITVKNPNPIQQLSKKYQPIQKACHNLTQAGFKPEPPEIYNELQKMQQKGDIFPGELQKYKKLLGV